jgi:hypothetical protein
MRRSTLFLLFTAVSLTLCLLMPLHARNAQQQPLDRMKPLRNLHITDLCLATEARYTRHPALADRHTAFQEHPLALEHFPSGSLILPPRHVRTAP